MVVCFEIFWPQRPWNLLAILQINTCQWGTSYSFPLPWRNADISLFSDNNLRNPKKEEKQKKNRSKHKTYSITRYRRREIANSSQFHLSPKTPQQCVGTFMSVSDLRLRRQVSMASQPYEVCSVALLLRETDEVFLNSHVDLCICKVWILFLLLYINSDSLQLSRVSFRAERPVWGLRTIHWRWRCRSDLQLCDLSWRKDAQAKWRTTNSNLIVY